ncbi:MAG: glycine cleavage system protein GcvH [candidate division Zixibacteria bacterium]|nr:glycine cleavage system protein GcvH [candidate division Zixibacteria bacterium]
MNIPADLKYSEDHEWVGVEGNIATIGVSDHAGEELSDVTFVELPSEGDELTVGEAFGVIETVKAAADLFAPISGKVVEVNTALEDDPEIIKNDPYGAGWFVKVEMSDPSELDKLMDAQAYKELIAG